MGKNDLYSVVARKIDGCTKADVKTVLEVYAETVKEVLAADQNETVVLPDLGKFSVKEVPEKSGVTSFTGKPWVKPAHNEIQFKLLKATKEI